MPGSVLSVLRMEEKFQAHNATCTTRSYHSNYYYYSHLEMRKLRV